jgi:hypothetical protein
MEPGQSRIEKMLKIEFTSDPRLSKFPLPEIPADYLAKYPGEPYTIPFDVTPEIAADWLTHRVIRRDITPRELLHEDFGPNRRFLPNALTGSSSRKGWVATFKDGEIKKTHQGIAFSWDGYLLDGQHRLAACLISGISYRPQLSQLVPWDAFTAMDSGRGRTADQFIDLPHPNLCAAAAKYILPVIKGEEARTYYDKRATKQEVLDLVYGWGIFEGPWMAEVQSAARAANIPNTPLAASVAMALAAGGDAATDQVQQFLNGLRKNFAADPRNYITIGNAGLDPRWVLRGAFSEGSSGKKRTFSSDETYGNVGVIRRCVQVWMDQEEFTGTQRTPTSRDLPKVWRADAVRQFHATKVS